MLWLASTSRESISLSKVYYDDRLFTFQRFHQFRILCIANTNLVSYQSLYRLSHTNTAMKTQKTKTDTYDSQLHLPVPTLYSVGVYGSGRRRDMIATKGKSEPRTMNFILYNLPIRSILTENRRRFGCGER